MSINALLQSVRVAWQKFGSNLPTCCLTLWKPWEPATVWGCVALVLHFYSALQCIINILSFIFQCLKYRTEQQQDIKKLEKLNSVLMRHAVAKWNTKLFDFNLWTIQHGYPMTFNQEHFLTRGGTWEWGGWSAIWTYDIVNNCLLIPWMQFIYYIFALTTLWLVNVKLNVKYILFLLIFMCPQLNSVTFCDLFVTKSFLHEIHGKDGCYCRCSVSKHKRLLKTKFCGHTYDATRKGIPLHFCTQRHLSLQPSNPPICDTL